MTDVPGRRVLTLWKPRTGSNKITFGEGFSRIYQTGEIIKVVWDKGLGGAQVLFSPFSVSTRLLALKIMAEVLVFKVLTKLGKENGREHSKCHKATKCTILTEIF